jgi:hypothetical protein
MTWDNMRSAGWQVVQYGGYPQPPEVVAMARDLWHGMRGDELYAKHRATIERTNNKAMRLENTYALYRDTGNKPPFID